MAVCFLVYAERVQPEGAVLPVRFTPARFGHLGTFAPYRTADDTAADIRDGLRHCGGLYGLFGSVLRCGNRRRGAGISDLPAAAPRSTRCDRCRDFDRSMLSLVARGTSRRTAEAPDIRFSLPLLLAYLRHCPVADVGSFYPRFEPRFPSRLSARDRRALDLRHIRRRLFTPGQQSPRCHRTLADRDCTSIGRGAVQPDQTTDIRHLSRNRLDDCAAGSIGRTPGVVSRSKTGGILCRWDVGLFGDQSGF